MPPIPKIQLAVQGGGAKLCDLLAAMDALQRLERDGRIHVTRLAGTSAGSIAAGLYAAGVDFDALRKQILASRPTLVGLFPRPTFLRFVRAVTTGKPMASLDPLKKALQAVFADRKIERFNQLVKPLIVVTTDLTNSKTHPHKDPEDFVVNALLDSCAIPFYFRGPGRKHGSMLLVDGGLCENLPVDFLAEYKEDGLLVGLSFRPSGPGTTPGGFLPFVYSLAEAAMGNSVRRAQLRLGEKQVLLLDGDIGTFDFDRALNEGMEKDRYGRVMAEAEKFFLRLIDDETKRQQPVIVESGPESSQSDASLDQIYKLYEAQHKHVKMKVAEVRMLVKLGALSTEPRSGRPMPDEVSYRIRFTAGGEPLACASIKLTDSDGVEYLGTVRRQVFDRNGKELRTIDLLGKSRKDPTQRLYLLFFNPVIKSGDGAAPYTLEYWHEARGLMAPLALDGVDMMGFHTLRSEGETGRIVLIAAVPDAFPNLSIRESPGTTGAARGRRMTDEELRLSELPFTAGSHYLGWIGEAVGSNEMFAAELYQPGFKSPTPQS